MNIKFNKIILHNFLSFGDSEVSLSERGYCVVKGVNNCKKDSALSNGSGKSSIWSGISYALTGETIQGLKSNIVNINGKDGCFVKLFFSIDSDQYEITRYKEYSTIGTDLKIIINGEDKSGKGVRESQQLLEQYLPDITTELLGSVIILGQGLPHKFSNNSPSGRKEVLEKLSKSDFMIQDIKERIEARSIKLADNKRALEDILLTATSQLDIFSKQLVNKTLELEKTKVVPEFDFLIAEKQAELDALTLKYTETQSRLVTLNKEVATINEKLIASSEEKSKHLLKLKEENDITVKPLKDSLTELNQSIYAAGIEITKLKAITDVCPTCHQKIPGANKPDTTEKETFLEHARKHAYELTEAINKKAAEFAVLSAEYSAEVDKDTSMLKDRLAIIKAGILAIENNPESSLEKISDKKLKCSNYITQLTNDRRNFFDNQNKLKEEVNSLSENITRLNNEITEATKNKQAIQQHIDVISKMNTLVKRDFRGFLLSSVIEFISKKAKEYAIDIFGTPELEFKLDGNNIDISYSGKTFENLSGGEKQRVDLILQFAIRDMMSQYLSFTSNILVLDEIFDGLDILGTTNVLNLISKRLTDVESVFIISHNESLEIPYDDIITVVKDEKGISKVKWQHIIYPQD